MIRHSPHRAPLPVRPVWVTTTELVPGMTLILHNLTDDTVRTIVVSTAPAPSSVVTGHLDFLARDESGVSRYSGSPRDRWQTGRRLPMK